MYHVQVTTSLLAEAATVSEGKLYIHAGGWDVLNVPSFPATFPQFALVLVIEMSIDEMTGDELEIRLIDNEEAIAVGVTGRLLIPGLDERSPASVIRVPLVVPFHAVTFTRPGIYLFKVSLAGIEIDSISLTVQMQP